MNQVGLLEPQVIEAVKTYFAQRGFNETPEPPADLVFSNTQGQKWRVEAKGDTRNKTIDFNTGMGQLLKQMKNCGSEYGLALPDIRAYRTQARKISMWVRRQLHLHFLFVTNEGDIEDVAPEPQ